MAVTNYDGALAEARTAFATSGKISGGVNVRTSSPMASPGAITRRTARTKPAKTFLGTNKDRLVRHWHRHTNSTNVAAIEPVAYNASPVPKRPPSR